MRLLAVLVTAALLAAPPRHGTVQRVTFHSDALGVDKHYFVYLPPSYASGRRFPVAYYLHGVGGGKPIGSPAAG
jgi:enterochelin esterase-like enzyme